MSRHSNCPELLKIAFVACNRNANRFKEDPSYIYRCENLANALHRLGHEVVLVHLGAFPLRKHFDVVVFHRPRYSWRLHATLALLRRKGTRLIADVDDLIFDEAFASYSPGALNRLISFKKTKRIFASHNAGLARFENITVSTSPLADEVKRCFPKTRISVVPNAVHRSWQELDVHPTPVNQREPVLTYMPGTRSHDRDFAQIAGVLSRLLDRYPKIRLEITGPLQFAIQARAGQIVHHEKLPFNDYHQRIRSGMVNLAPLEQTPFTRCKSALKVIEAGFWDIPTVCSFLPDAERFEKIGAVIVREEAAWFPALERLFCDPCFYQEQVMGLREHILKQADVEHIAQNWLACTRIDVHHVEDPIR